MAALYSGIQLKLKSPQTSWEEKLKLARFAWTSSQCLMPNKEQVLLDWCSHALTGWYHQKVEFSQHVLEGLWCYLDDLLHSRKLKHSKNISLRLNMAQLLLRRLQDSCTAADESSASSLVSVCWGIFSSPALSSVFTTKYELMVDLVANFCSLGCRRLRRLTGMDPLLAADQLLAPSRRSDVFEVLLQVLSCYLSIQRQQANPNRVFSLVATRLLQPLLLLRLLLTTSGDAERCRDIRIRIDSILQLALFSPELLTSYSEELLPSREDSGKRGPGGAKGALKPVDAVLCKLGTEDPLLRYQLKTNALPLLFRFFLNSYRKERGESEEERRMLCFYFLTRLVPALHVDLDGVACSSDNRSLALLALESLLTQTLSANLYNVAADRIRHGQVQLGFYRPVAQTLLNQAQSSVPAWYRCLKVLLSLNHLILEPDLDRLLSSAWVDADCMEARVQRVRQLLVSGLLQTYTKLHQLPRLFSELLSVICRPTPDHLRPPLLPEGVSASLRNCLLDTPTSQGLEICSLVLDSIRTDPIPALVKEDGGDRDGSSLKLLSLSRLLHTVLFSLKTLDNTSPVPLVRRAAGLMEDMRQLVQVLLSAITTWRENPERQQWQQRMQEAALLLRYSSVEVDTLFHLHCSSYTRLDFEAEAPLMPEDAESFCSPASRLLLRLLALQDMKNLLLRPGPPEPATTALLGRAARFVLSDGDLQVRPDAEQAWGGQLDFVDATSYPVAHWYLLMSNLPLLVPHLSAGGVRCIADALVVFLLDRDSVSLSSSRLLLRSTLTELPSLFSAAIRSLTERTSAVILAAATGRIPTESALLSNECLVEHILASSQTGQMFVLLTESQINELLDVFRVLSQLDPDGLCREDMSSVFLLLLFLLCCSSAGDAVFLQTLLSLLTTLLQGKNFASVLKLVHGGSMLQAAVSSLWHRSFVSGSDGLGVMEAVQSFIRSSVELIIVRNSSVRLNLQQFTSYLTRKAADPEPGPGSVLSRPIFLVALASLSQTVASHLGRNEHLDQTLTQVLTRTTASMALALEYVLRSQVASQRDAVLTQASVVDIVTVLLRCEGLLARNQRLCLTRRGLYHGVCRQIIKEICSAPRPMDFLLTALNFLSVFYKAVEEEEGEEVEELYLEILQTVHSLLTAQWMSTSDLSDLEPAVQKLLFLLLQESNTTRFSLLLLQLREGLKAADQREALSAVTIIKLLSCCQLPETCCNALWLVAPQIISAMVLLVKSSSQDVSLTHRFTVPVVTSLTSLLRRGEGLITNPHHVTVVLGALQAVPLRDMNSSVYLSTFLALHESLFAILQCHPQVMLNAAPSFLNVFHRLLASIMHEGRQRGDSKTGPDNDEYLQSSRLMERMYSHIAAAAESFTTLTAFMVAEYVTQLQKVTLRADVKQHLTEGIYRILDLCVEQDVKFVTAGLQAGVREVFNELYGSYTHHHKAQRQGEDKYTA